MPRPTNEFNSPRVVTEQAWMEEAACRGVDTNIFFPVRGAPETAAKEICAMCAVIKPCGEYAITELGYNDPGVYGGMSWRERRIAMRKRRAA